MVLNSPDLPAVYRQASADPEITWIFHQVSLWEIQIKYDLGKLKLPRSPADLFPLAIESTGFRTQGIEDEGIFLLGKLPSIHRDPFDRLLIAHAVLRGWEMATTDPVIRRYPLRVF
jgi:PIN domain nuclease of toxin-antitoxin system